MGLTLLTPPASEPISLEQAKNHLRVDISDDDSLIERLIRTARRQAEVYTSRQLITAAYQATFDDFPSIIRGGGGQCGILRLPKSPVRAVSAIQYLDSQGQTQTLPTSVYTVDLTQPLARISLKFGQVWPPTYIQANAVTVNFTVGYGDNAEDVPDTIISAMLLMIGSMYANREEAAAELTTTVTRLLDFELIQQVL